jgi:hypothetical protein
MSDTAVDPAQSPDPNLAIRVEQALRYDSEETAAPATPAAVLHEDFDFFVVSGESPRPDREPTVEDCRALYRKLREQMVQLEHDRAEFDMRVALFEQANAQKPAEESDEVNWKEQYLRLKGKYQAIKQSKSSDISIVGEESKVEESNKENTKKKHGHQKKSPRGTPQQSRGSPKREPSPVPKSHPPQQRARQSPTKAFSRYYPLNPRYPLDFTFNPGPVVRRENVSQTTGRASVRYRNGMTGVLFANGTQTVNTGSQTYTFHTNGDIAIMFEDGAHGYRYAAANTTELDLPDGTQLFVFADGQRERHLPDGHKEILLPDGRVKAVMERTQRQS